MTLPVLRRILNDTPGTATDIDFDFQTIQTYVNTELISRDGSVAMTSPLTGVAAVSSDQYATLAQAEALIPVGVMWDFGGEVAPAGWALCDGSAQSITDPVYAALYAVIGVKFGDPGGGNFNLPDSRGRVFVGADLGGDPLYDAVGATGGQRDSELLEHNHTQAGHSHAVSISGGSHNHTQNPHGHSISNGTQVVRAEGGGNAQLVAGTGAFGPYNTFFQSATDSTATNQTSTSHSHTVSQTTRTPVINDAGSGTTLTDKNFQPFVVATKIIKL